jgi:hypothetical protein
LKSYGDEQPSDSRSLVLQNLELQTIIRGLEKDNAILRENSREKDVEVSVVCIALLVRRNI